ncbi:MAG: hypothetical protein V4579_06580 [Pseudomonadota bacterium]
MILHSVWRGASAIQPAALAETPAFSDIFQTTAGWRPGATLALQVRDCSELRAAAPTLEKPLLLAATNQTFGLVRAIRR